MMVIHDSNACRIFTDYLRMAQVLPLRHFVMWMQQGRICILGKIEFSIDNENAGKNAQVKLYFMPELKIILYLWKK